MLEFTKISHKFAVRYFSKYIKEAFRYYLCSESGKFKNGGIITTRRSRPL